MGPEWTPLYFSDEERFISIIADVQQRQRFRETADLRDVMFSEAMLFGVMNRPEMVPDLIATYDALLDRGMPLQHRMQVLDYIRHFVKTVNPNGVFSFLSFVNCDPDRTVASIATGDFVYMAPAHPDDPLARPKEVIAMIQARQPRNRGAVFGFLMTLGDPRLCDLLRPVRDDLTDGEVKQAALCEPAFMAAATIEFIVSWMEDLVNRGEENSAVFGDLASHLVIQACNADANVMTVEQQLPASVIGHPAMLRPMAVADYIPKILPRMRDLERAESGPKVMPSVIATWESRAGTFGEEAPPHGPMTGLFRKFASRFRRH